MKMLINCPRKTYRSKDLTV